MEDTIKGLFLDAIYRDIDCQEEEAVQLGEISVAFEPETLQNEHTENVTQNFFDDVNLKICTVRNNGSLGITAKSLAENDVISARTKDRGPPYLMKLSPNSKLAILQRQVNSVDLIGCVDRIPKCPPESEGSEKAHFKQ
ncbi:unnamed protein product [Heligmosomoides polygyrus]|uniref:Reverse transcriptase domain-containing protein n=1 Tax=Heligmosomoides polygyrus TaxID=6339 RepID=A0A183FGH6_HELPZ|nr:unnamed protein product [Heligmosomoides polygyrus]